MGLLVPPNLHTKVFWTESPPCDPNLQTKRTDSTAQSALRRFRSGLGSGLIQSHQKLEKQTDPFWGRGSRIKKIRPQPPDPKRDLGGTGRREPGEDPKPSDSRGTGREFPPEYSSSRLGAFPDIAPMAEQLEVLDLVPSSIKKRNDVIQLSFSFT